MQRYTLILALSLVLLNWFTPVGSGSAPEAVAVASVPTLQLSDEACRSVIEQGDNAEALEACVAEAASPTP